MVRAARFIRFPLVSEIFIKKRKKKTKAAHNCLFDCGTMEGGARWRESEPGRVSALAIKNNATKTRMKFAADAFEAVCTISAMCVGELRQFFFSYSRYC